MIYKKYIKLLIDIILSLLLITILSPIMFISMIFLFIVNDRKVLFVQKRLGKNEKVFNLYKFKTMNDKKDENGLLLPDGQRLTKVGGILRKFSIDELPQLINVIKGDMSLVGPRPLFEKYLHLYNDYQRRRHSVRPGITGWAQINGRNALNWDEKFEYDMWYTKNVSFLIDAQILIKTLKKISISENINQPGHITVEEFKGSK